MLNAKKCNSEEVTSIICTCDLGWSRVTKLNKCERTRTRKTEIFYVNCALPRVMFLTFTLHHSLARTQKSTFAISAQEPLASHFLAWRSGSSSCLNLLSVSSSFPQPPPPGVWSTIKSPVSNCMVPLPPILMTLGFPLPDSPWVCLIQRLSPGAPQAPPFRP